jgi:UMF1 family MFS transporter
MKLTKPEKSWVLYDVANSAFVLIVVTTIMPVFFKEYAAYGQAGEISTFWLGTANSAASLLLAACAPLLGGFADAGGHKKRFLGLFMAAGVLLTFSFSFTSRGMWVFCLLAYGAARFVWAGANIFYDSLLHDVTAPQNADSVSAKGYAWGYIGSVIPFLGVAGLIFTFKTSAALPAGAVKTGFIIVGLWWLFFSLPILKNVKQKPVPARRPDHTTGFKQLFRTFKRICKNRNTRYFLLAYFFYIDGVNTVISMSAAYGKDIGLDTVQLILAILMIQITAFPFTLLYGGLAGRFGTRRLLFAGIFVYCFITCFAFFLPVFSAGAKVLLFWVLAFLIATSMGGIQALSRSFFLSIAPFDRSAEYFGFYNMFGKFAAVMGPFMMGITGKLAGHSRWGVLSMVIFFVLGAVFLSKVKKEPTA